MPSYIVYTREETTDANELKVYSEKVPATIDGHPLTPLAFYGQLEVLEGPEFEGAVILEFPSASEAKAWYHSDAYQDVLKHRKAGAYYRVFLIEGKGKV